MKKLQQTFILITCIIVIAVAAAQRDGKIWGEQLSNNKKLQRPIKLIRFAHWMMVRLLSIQLILQKM